MTSPLPNSQPFDPDCDQPPHPQPWAEPAIADRPWQALPLDSLSLDHLITVTLEADLVVPAGDPMPPVPAVDLSSPWVYAHYMAMVQWLQDYTPLDDSPLEQVRGWLEAFYHTCKAEVWPVAEAIVTTPTPAGSALYCQLGLWGHFQEQVELCEALIDRVEPPLAYDMLWMAGEGRRQLGQRDKAKTHYDALLRLNPAPDNAIYQLKARINLEKERAFQDSRCDQLDALLLRAIALEEWALAVSLLTDLALLQGYRGRYRHALARAAEAQHLVETHQLTEQEPLVMNTLATVYQWHVKPDLALPLLYRCLDIYQANNNLLMQAKVLLRLGRCYFEKGDFETAIAHAQDCLDLCRQGYYCDQEALALADLGMIYTYGLGQFTEALPYLKQAEHKALAIQVMDALIMAPAQQAYCYGALGDFEAAEQAIQMALTYAANMDETSFGYSVVYACLAKVRWEQGRYFTALTLMVRYLWLSPPWAGMNGRLLWAKTWETLSQVVYRWVGSRVPAGLRRRG